jgi:hypothetical protein
MYSCPVCGYDRLKTDPRGVGGYSFVTCPCCMFEFGFDDLSVGETYESYREKWIRDGMPWRATWCAAPPRWDAAEQLKRVAAA